MRAKRAVTGMCAIAAVVLLTPSGAGANRVPEHWVFHAGMSGAREVPGPGDIGASGDVQVTVNAVTGEICWDLTVRNIAGAVTAAHIHAGQRDEAGPVVQALTAPTGEHSAGCATNADVATGLVSDPSDFYVNVHSSPFPGGAVRGQLAGPHN